MPISNSSRDIAARVRRHGTMVVEAMARNTEAEAKKSILRGTKSGRRYRVPGTSRFYTASAPGQAPAPRTGDLANSIYTRVPADYIAQVGSELKYSKIEFGYGRAAPRPYLRPANDMTMRDRRRLIAAITRQARMT